MAVITKELARAYYGQDPKFSYWDGCSTGGRQGLKEAQDYPEDFDGILVGAPAINWTSFITAELYPQIVIQRDLGGVPLTPDQLKLASSAAVSACDTDLNGEHAGYISDPAACRYDPTKDRSVLCKKDGGSNSTAACLSGIQATAINKMWYGQTSDGSVPSPSVDNGFGANLAPKQLWFGVSRGTSLNSPYPAVNFLADSESGKPAPFPISTDQVAMNLQKATIATPSFRNGSGNGSDGWTALSYKDLVRAHDEGIRLQPVFANINTDDPDLSKFAARKGKILSYHGLADQLIPPEGSLNYYSRVVQQLGGIEKVQAFFRFYEVPGMGHCFGNGSVNGCTGISPPADPALPAPGQLFQILQNWVEQGVVPDSIRVSNTKGTVSRPLCVFPKKIVYLGSGDRATADSYGCR
jgi:feruloyl esterase